MTPALTVVRIAAALAAAMLSTTARAEDPSLRSDLEALSRRSVFFGHQSVGNNILDGVRDLLAEAGVPLRVLEVPSARGLASGTFGHALVAENGDPLRKLASFETALGPGPTTADVALVKLCFVDVDERTDVGALFGRYRTALSALRTRFPRTTFVHVTVPLTADAPGLKGVVKRLLGRDRSRPQNARREEFNALMRQAYAGQEPLFDLARQEATRPDGTTESFELDGRRVLTLVPGYTDDGGHLDAAGRKRVARALIALLASLPARADP